MNDFPKWIRRHIARKRKLYTDLNAGAPNDSLLSRFLKRPRADGEGYFGLMKDAKVDVKPLKPLLNELRALKSEGEIANMRLAGKASGKAITKAMGSKFSTERALASFLEYHFRECGCDSAAYVPVVAGGEVIQPVPV